MNIILKPKIEHYTKEIAKFVTIIILGFLFILAIIFIKYEPVYEVTIAGEKLGYIEKKEEFENLITEKIINQTGNNIENVSLSEEPEYELKLISRTVGTNQEEVIENLKNYAIITYKYYYVALNNENVGFVDTLEDAQEIVEQIKAEYDGEDLELDLQIFEKYTQNEDEVKVETVENTENNAVIVAEELKKEKEESESLAVINGIKLSVLPVSGRITSRYGESSSLRSSTHTGLDIACVTGTDIKATSGGTVIFAGYNGAYGNLVKIDHGNGVETWYGHCSKIYVKESEAVNAGDVIAAVGSTGNSTGPHLHFEIRINGNTVDPQDYIY